MNLQQAIDLVKLELPDDWMIHIELMNGYEKVVLETPNLNEIEIEEDDAPLGKLLIMALNTAQEID
jgi:hypothetical protein